MYQAHLNVEYQNAISCCFAEDDTPCGFPDVLFNLVNLKKLSMKHQGLVHIPDSIAKLKQLENFDISFNPNLLSVSAEITHCKLKGRFTHN